MPARLCRHIQPDGTPCRAIAVTGHPCCIAHTRLHRRLRRQQRSARIPAVRLGPLQDYHAIQRALTRVAQAIAAHTLNLDRAAEFLERLRIASEDLSRSADS